MDARFELEFECQEAWEEMREVAPGERRCDRCSENVVDLSRMTRKRALAVVQSASPPCISYLVRGVAASGGEVVFAREVARGGMIAAAASLLAACSTEAPPTCELAPEPAPVSMLDESAPLGGPLPTEHVGAPVPAAPPVTPAQNGAPTLASPGDPNDVSSVAAPPAPHPIPIHRMRGRIARSHYRPGPVAVGDRNDP